MFQAIVFVIFTLFSTRAFADLSIVTTTTDLEALVNAISGGKAQVVSIAKGTQDAHQIEAKPSFMVKMRNADLVITQGLELESAWIVPLIRGGRNPKISVGTKGFLELGDKLSPLEIPKGNVSRAEGDVHPGGNPHFQLDPIRLGEAAVIVADRMGELDPANRALYKRNAESYQQHLKDKNKEWKARIEKTKIKEVVTYHKTFSYFLDRYGIKNPIQLEPRPGIPPTASHLLEVIDLMKKNDIRLVLIENLYDEKAGDKVKNDIQNARIALVPVSVGGEPEIKTNEQLIERVVKTIEENSH